MSSNVLPVALATSLHPGEAARPVPGASRYWVTTTGRVLSLVNGIRQLRTPAMGRGYPGVELSRDPDRDDGLPTRWWRYVHHLVAQAFLGPLPVEPGVAYQIDHVDGDKTNNDVRNLRYVTRSENLQYAIANGLNPATKLKPEDVWLLRCRAAAVSESTAIAEAVRIHGMTTKAVRRALSGRSWGGVPQPADRPDVEALARALLCSKAEASMLLRCSPFSRSSAYAGRLQARLHRLYERSPDQAA